MKLPILSSVLSKKIQIPIFLNVSAQWAAKLESVATEIPSYLSMDSDGAVYITGYFTSGSVGVYDSTNTLIKSPGSSGSNEVFLVKYLSDGSVGWATNLGSPGADQGYYVATDVNKNVYVTGYYSFNGFTAYHSNTTAFGTTLNISGSGADVFFVKYNSVGKVQWLTRITGTSTDDIGRAIAADPTGNVYVSGSFASNPLTFYNSNATAFGTTISSSTTYDVFLSKYDTNGNVQWITSIRGDSNLNDIPNAMTADSDGNVYVTGYYASTTLTAYNSDSTQFATILDKTNSSGNDGFVAKYDSSGNVQWLVKIGGSGSDICTGIKTDSDKNIYVIGHFTSTSLIFYNSDGTAFGTQLTNSGSGTVDGFIVKYNSSGNVQWVSKIGGTGNDRFFGIDMDVYKNIYVTGDFSSSPLRFYHSNATVYSSTLTTGGSFDAFIAKYDRNGNVQWITKSGGTGSDNGQGVGVDSNGNVYTTGSYTSTTLTANNYTNGTVTTSDITLGNINTNNNTFIIKYIQS